MTQDTARVLISADVRCFSQDKVPGCRASHKETAEALWEIFDETFKQQDASLEGATYQWQDGGGHACLSYKEIPLDPSKQDGLIQAFADIVESRKDKDGALPALQEACVYTQINESGKLRLSIANPDDDRYRGTLVHPTPAAD